LKVGSVFAVQTAPIGIVTLQTICDANGTGDSGF